MPTTSTIPTVKAALVSGLQARTNLASVQVSYAWPGPATNSESIWLDSEPQRATTDIPVMRAGRKPREDDYTILVVIQVVQEGTDATTASAAAAESRSYALLAELENMLADDPTLNQAAGAATRMQVAGHIRQPLTPSGAGWTSRLEAEVTVKTRLA